MRLISLVEQLLLLLEKQNQPMHFGGLFIFELPVDADATFVTQLVQQMQTATTPPTFPFNQVLYKLTFWKTETVFEIKHHLHHVDLRQLADIDNLHEYISKEHAKMLDKSYPLWECHIIEGIDSANANVAERFALYFKIHHALVDGIAAMRLVQKSLSPLPDETMNLPAWALLQRDSNNLKAITPTKRSLTATLKQQVSTIKPVFSELKNTLQTRHLPSHVKTTQAPNSILNQPISELREVITSSYQLQRFAKIAKAMKVSKNDVVLAVCAGALRRYLLTLDELPEQPLTAFVPISLRKDDSATGNQTSLVLCNLATHSSDPIERLQIIHNSMKESKARFARMNQAEVINYSAIVYAWEGVNLLTNAYPKKQAFNIMISNVPGPREELYWNGARLSALYPVSVIYNGQAINMTLVTYLDRVDFGIVACTQSLPNIHHINTLLEQSLCEYEKILQKKQFIAS